MFSIKRGNRYLLGSILSFLIGSILIGFYVSLTGETLNFIYNIVVSQWGLVFIPILLYFLITKTSIKQTCNFRKLDWVNGIISVVLAWSILPLLTLINLLSQLFVKNVIAESMLEAMKYPLWILLLLMAVTPAILEEIAMRGIILHNYGNKNVLAACLVNGLCFGIFHMNINQFTYAFAMGILFAFVVLITKSIYSSMIMHFTINGTMIVLQKFFLWMNNKFMETSPELMAEMMDTTVDASYILSVLPVFLIICLVTTPIAGLLIFALIKYNKKENLMKLTVNEALEVDAEPIEKKEKIATPALITVIAIFVIFVTIFEFLIPLYFTA